RAALYLNGDSFSPASFWSLAATLASFLAASLSLISSVSLACIASVSVRSLSFSAAALRSSSVGGAAGAPATNTPADSATAATRGCRRVRVMVGHPSGVRWGNPSLIGHLTPAGRAVPRGLDGRKKTP